MEDECEFIISTWLGGGENEVDRGSGLVGVSADGEGEGLDGATDG